MGEETKEERFWHRTFGQAQKRPSALGYLKIRGRRPPRRERRRGQAWGRMTISSQGQRLDGAVSEGEDMLWGESDDTGI